MPSATIAALESEKPERLGIAWRYRLSRLYRYRYLPQYFWYHKRRFGIDNTKFDISYCVFLESFLGDQYGIRAFLDTVPQAREISFIDAGRNHGLVFYYTMYHIMTRGLPVKTVHYYGIDPSPLKFVYFNFHDYLRRNGITVHYHIIDRAVVFDGEPHVTLRYGENNFGNFHVAGSNYAQKKAIQQVRLEYVDITVETMQFSELQALIAANADKDALIVKIDCKNRTDQIFADSLAKLSAHGGNFLLAAEADGSSGQDLSRYRRAGGDVLMASHPAVTSPA